MYAYMFFREHALALGLPHFAAQIKISLWERLPIVKFWQ
jgi:hypothetical protein